MGIVADNRAKGRRVAAESGEQGEYVCAIGAYLRQH